MIKNSTKGFIIVASPAVTDSTFAIAHGPFAHNFWPFLKMKAKISEDLSRKRLKKLRRKKRDHKILRVYAHINPFHNLDMKPDRDK